MINKNLKNMIMRKSSYLWLAAAATMLAACAEKETFNEVNFDDEKDVIAFDTYHSKKTKSPIETETNLTKANGGIGVYAFKYKEEEKYDATNNPTGIRVNDHKINFSSISGQYTNPIFDNTMVYYNPDFGAATAANYHQKFIYDYPRYWDKKMYYAFFAYAPQSASGVVLDDATGLFEFTKMHKIQCASDAQDKAVDSGTGSVTKKQYSVLPAGSNNAAIKDYLIAPCKADEKWHATDQMTDPYMGKDPKTVGSGTDYEKANITVGFTFSHLLSKLNVNVKAKNEWLGDGLPNIDASTPATKNYYGHEYKGVESISITKLEITNMPELSNLNANYLTKCQQNQVDFATIYSGDAVTYDPSYYTTSLGIVSSSVDNTTTPATTTYSINGETATADPLYILAGGSVTENPTTHVLTFTNPGNNVVDGYVDQAFTYYVAPNKPNTGHKHELTVDYHIKYVDGKDELISRTIDLSAAAYNFTEMKPSFIYTINLTISLDQVYVTVEDFEWNSGTPVPPIINVNGDDL